MAGSALNRQVERRGTAEEAAVLVVDDEADIRELLELSLIRMGLGVVCAGSIAEAKAALAAREFALCLTDMRLADGDGLDLVRHITSQCADLPVAVITAFGSTESAVTALKSGAFDYLAKPLSLEQLRALIKSALKLPQKPVGEEGGQLLGDSPAMEQVRLTIDKLARSQAPVYISGESGSGKELAARLIHALGARSDQPFVAVNCGAIPENLLESEFFGYRRGAFTGADADKDGFFQAADGGTLFLDEVADLPLAMQVKLLRVIQEKRVRKIGGTVEDAADVRVICATHQNLARRVDSGNFRQDLYYRLAVIELHMPPLRDRREDIPLLAQAALQRRSGAGERRFRLSQAALEALCRYDFPGNVRELENILERAMALCASDSIGPEDLQIAPSPPEAPAAHARWPLQDYLDTVEREAIVEALEKTRYNRTAAAKLLGVTFRSLRYRMERLGID
jgi:two-component system response regulator PilR (NtrC family)